MYAFERSATATGLDLAALTDATRWLEERLGKRLPGALLRSGPFPG